MHSKLGSPKCFRTVSISFSVEAPWKDYDWENILHVRPKYIVNVYSPVFDKKTVRMRAEKPRNFLLTFIIHDLRAFLIFQKHHLLQGKKFQNSETFICFAVVLLLLFGKSRRLNCYSSSDGLMKGAVFAMMIKQQRNALTSHGCSLSPVICKIQYDREKSLRIYRVFFSGLIVVKKKNA